MKTMVQLDLQGNMTPQGVCCESCFSAKGKVCDCRCKGQFHGVGRKQQDLMVYKKEQVPIKKCRLCGYSELYLNDLCYQCWLGEQDSEEEVIGNVTSWGRTLNLRKIKEGN